MRFQRNNERRGVILMVVLALLTLFAIVGVAFVLYAQSEATSARVAREAETAQRADIPPEECLAMFLGQFLYDVPDDTTGVGSGVRGHSLARTMYGLNYVSGSNGVTGSQIVPLPNNINAFNGVGRLRFPSAFGPTVTDDMLVNYTWFGPGSLLRDPERYGSRLSPAALQANPFIGANVSYTYPDLNNFFLAAVKASGRVLTPSFHRPWLFNPGMALNNMNNPNWTNAQGRYLTLRPRPADHAGFPAPDDAWGDVKNLVWAPGGNDSIWIDIGAPVQTAPDGTKYKMLVAPLIMDLDGRINLNTAGNMLGPNNTHGSNQGWLPSEVNLSLAMSTDWQNLFQGNPLGGTPRIYGKYGWPNSATAPFNTPPLSPNGGGGRATSGSFPHSYMQVDINGRNESNLTQYSSPLVGPGFGGPNPIYSWPIFGAGFNNGSQIERTNLPSLYGVDRPALYVVNPLGQPNRDRVFRASDMEPLLRPNNSLGTTPVDTGSAALVSDLLWLCPTSFGPGAASPRWRNMVTTSSADLVAPGLSPWLYPSPTNIYKLNPNDTWPPTTPALSQAPTGTAIPFPTLPPTVAVSTPVPPQYPTSEFGSANNLPDWRAVDAALGRINLNRPLPPYPHMGSGLTPPWGAPLVTYGTSYAGAPAAAQNQYLAAQTARQALANSIYRRLVALTGVPLPANAAAPLFTSQALAMRRWLAQLAVNIVDYIDDDDISTPFNFYNTTDGLTANLIGQTAGTAPTNDPDSTGANPLFWVFGTELPRVVLNEALAETSLPTLHGLKAATPAEVKLWVELFNPLPPFSNPPPNAVQMQDYYRVPFYMVGPNGKPSYSPYRVTLDNALMPSGPLTGVGLNANVLGKGATVVGVLNKPYKFPRGTNDADFTNPALVQQAGGGAQLPPATGPVMSPGIDPQNFFLIGPPASANKLFVDPFVPQTAKPPGSVPPTVPVLRTLDMKYNTTFIRGSTTDERTTGLTVLLRRLANPYMPFNGSLLLPSGLPNTAYNPFVTIDYISQVPLHAAGLGIGKILPFASRGKRQPYAARTQTGATPLTLLGTSPVTTQQLTNPKPPPLGGTAYENVITTFGRRNFPLPQSGHYDWLVHLDRQPISPMELLHVSAYQPYQLTQQFVLGSDNLANPANVANVFRHYAPWLEAPYVAQTNPWASGLPSQAATMHRLYRLFEFLECGGRAFGIDPLGRNSGKVNINTVWDPEIFQALCDPNSSNYVNTAATVNAIFGQMLQSRSPNYVANATNPLMAIGPTNVNPPPTGYQVDMPFQGLATGASPAANDPQYPTGKGIQNTLLRPSSAGNGNLLLEKPVDTAATHPYLRTQLLTKIFNNVTTRSNVFAVFLTVGFFEVTNANASPPTLGPEVGRSEGRQVRHRMFAIVDRTNMSVFSTTAAPGWSVTVTPATGPQTVPIQLVKMSGPNPNTGVPWQVQAGMRLVYEPGTPNEETVVVQLQNGKLVGTFTKSHPYQPGNPYPPVTGSATITVIQRGNPGPWKRYDPRQDPGVVLYYNIID